MNTEQMEMRKGELLKEEYFFIRNAFMIIKEMVELNNRTDSEYSTLLVDEILHSIFFLGKIKTPSLTPKDIVTDDEMYDALKYYYPRPFDLYSSQLPRRSPFSCVLDMIVHLEGQENEDMIIKKLQQLIHRLKEGNTDELVPSTICISQNTNILNAVKYYGVSMSTSGAKPGQIMIAASCFGVWDDYVAGAVMTYYPNKVKKSYFDGTIILPKNIRCEAFNLNTGEQKPSCISCVNLFGLNLQVAYKEWPYGNCAEAESVSNLLKNEEDVKLQAQPTSETCTEENRLIAKEDVLKHLKSVLRMMKFKWDNNFYTPQVEILNI
ncbi:uncharacterized protein LOC122970524 [Thunnus albacares]|uniref:uncharacterized protein LOC122970524 n=1 Tax=Thunnus albacares TaxID=8236 RepID=UPI001CF621A2|nr:uncharacterized protein LOC122970524 [Thunnus albacares]